VAENEAAHLCVELHVCPWQLAAVVVNVLRWLSYTWCTSFFFCLNILSVAYVCEKHRLSAVLAGGFFFLFTHFAYLQSEYDNDFLRVTITVVTV
jgi:hypothetical protein